MNSKFTAATSYATRSDEQIWSAFKNGDRDALASIYHRYFNFMIQYASKISSDRDLVKDIIHDLFVEIWNNRLNLAVPQSVKGYLVSSMQRKMIRKVKKERTFQIGFSRIPFSNSVSSKEDQLIIDQVIEEKKIIIHRAMDALTKRQREAVYLKFYANMSYKEIALTMDISTDSTYNLISKAIDILYKGLRGPNNLVF